MTRPTASEVMVAMYEALLAVQDVIAEDEKLQENDQLWAAYSRVARTLSMANEAMKQ